ncbi:MAG: hypothetical protein M3Q70_04120 [bacterium]|nr:hypothetical protein [bacterium]
MSRYEYQTSYHNKRTHARRTKLMAVVAIGFVLLLASFIIYDRIKNAIDNEQPESIATVSAVESATTSLFSTPYYQFQADKTWVEVPESNTPTKFVYKSKNGPLVQHQMIIYIGEPPANEVIGTRIYPVEVQNNGSLSGSLGVSEHCRNGAPNKALNEPQQTKYLQVSFNCNVGSNTYRVLVGAIGGTPTIPIKRPSGETQNYTIIYDDVTAYPTSNKIDPIISTFIAR